MKTLKLALGIAVVSLVGIGIVAARPPLAPAVLGKDTKKPVFVTGSLIPQRVDVKAIGTQTTDIAGACKSSVRKLIGPANSRLREFYCKIPQSGSADLAEADRTNGNGTQN